MELTGKFTGTVTPARNPLPIFSLLSKTVKKSENSNPNHTNPTTFKASKNRHRKFVVAKRSTKREKEREGSNNKCLTLAYENLKASQDEFFIEKNDDPFDKTLLESEFGENDDDPDEIEASGEKGSSLNIKRRREKWLEEARESVPEPGCGRVMYLVNAFEKLLTIPKSNERKKDGKVMKWALPGLQQDKETELQVSSDSFCPSDFSVTSESLGLDSSSVLSSSHVNNGSVLSRISGSGRKTRRNSSESTATFGGDRWKKSQLKARPFKLRTEQRGKSKQEQLAQKLQQTMMEEEKQRIQIAQSLPRTTDEPQCLVKPPVKESTKPIDLVLHSDVRATGRAEFDEKVAEKMSVIEQYKQERQRLEKLAEEAEIRRLRKELVPKAQPMPFFDRPFIPKRSLKLPTIPREPKFHLPQRKKIKSCMSWNEISCYAEMR